MAHIRDNILAHFIESLMMQLFEQIDESINVCDYVFKPVVTLSDIGTTDLIQT